MGTPHAEYTQLYIHKIAYYVKRMRLYSSQHNEEDDTEICDAHNKTQQISYRPRVNLVAF